MVGIDKTNLKNIFVTWDYSFYQKYLGSFGILCAGMQILFYLLLSFGFGYQESLPLRISAATGLAGFYFLPKSNPLKTRHKLYIELVYIINLPILFSHLLIINHANIYWVSSMVFCGLIYGLLSQQLIGLTSSLLILPLAIILHPTSQLHNYDANKMTVLGAILCITMYILSSAIRSMMQVGFETILRLNVEKTKAEQMEKNFRKLQARDEVIRRYVRPSILTEIALGKDPLTYTPQTIKSSILFTDMRNYTRFSEAVNDDRKYQLLNNYFSAINQAIFKNHGEVDKIMGDAVMATFPNPGECLKACTEMRLALSEKNRIRVNQNKVPLKFGTGISYGEVLSANFGSQHKLDRTIVGDPVNVGSRLEQLTKIYDLDVIASEEFIKENKDSYPYYRLIDEVIVKGKTKPLKIFELFGHNHDAVIEYKLATKEQINTIIQHKINGDFEEARKLLYELITKCPQHRYRENSLMDTYLYAFYNIIESFNTPNREALAG
ncbi:MAG: adenylate/guanylate cyclase domain-containing protein [Bdellovibrionota bacterium]